MLKKNGVSISKIFEFNGRQSWYAPTLIGLATGFF
jgi:hypothetical protein